MSFLLLAAGLALLLFGGHWLVSGADGLARRLGVPAFVIGALVMGFGTSAPELMVSVLAALDGSGGIAVGNVIGSNIANILLILGLTALAAPIRADDAVIRSDLAWMVAAAGIPIALFVGGTVGRTDAGVLLLAFAAFLVLTLRRGGPAVEDGTGSTQLTARAVLSALLGLVLVLTGARLLVTGATDLATALGVSEALIGLTIVAVGTSLPELATSLIAARRGQAALALGNVVGSNIFNVFGILGLAAMVAPVPVAPRFLTFDVPTLVLASLALAAFLLIPSRRIGRTAGLAFVLGYVVYVMIGATL